MIIKNIRGCKKGRQQLKAVDIFLKPESAVYIKRWYKFSFSFHCYEWSFLIFFIKFFFEVNQKDKKKRVNRCSVRILYYSKDSFSEGRG